MERGHALSVSDEGAARGRAHLPLIVTVELPAELQARMNALRAAHYPPERNWLKAHVTLFHALPPSIEPELRRALAMLTAELAPPRARIAGIMSLDGGTAVRIESEKVLAMHDRLADRFHGVLSAQDDHPPRLHVTVQNKVAREAARALQGRLEREVKRVAFRFRALVLHAYRGGPWELRGRWPFRGRLGNGGVGH